MIEHYTGWLEGFETAGIDTFILLKIPQDPSHVVIVGISDDDYKEYFAETSPLNPGKLQEIIDAIALAGPKVIGVDLDTSSEGMQEIRASAYWPPIVWAQDAVMRDQRLEALPAHGGKLHRRSDDMGISVLEQDADGIIRRYFRKFPVHGERTKSFPWAVVLAYCKDELKGSCGVVAENASHPPKVLLLNFSGERYDFSPLSAKYVLTVSKEKAWRTNGPFRNKIVLLGGFYRAARDVHVTPVGQMAGVQLMAQAIESELSGGGIRLTNELVGISLDIMAGILLVLLHYHFPRKAFVLNLAAVPIFSLFASYIAFSTMSRWFNFVPIALGVLIHELHERNKEYRQLKAEVASLRSRYG